MPYKDPEKQKAYMKTYREQNKVEIAAHKKEWNEKNREEIYKKQKEYRQTPEGKKSQKIGMWKHQGMIAVNNDWDIVYVTYINTTCCNFCCKEFISSKDKHLDHDHKTGEIRGVLCCSCNKRDVYAT